MFSDYGSKLQITGSLEICHIITLLTNICVVSNPLLLLVLVLTNTFVLLRVLLPPK